MATTFRRLFVERADQIMASNTELYAGVRDLVQRLASSGLILGILSTKFRYRICQILNRYGLTDRFTAIVGVEDVEKHKPDPEGLRLLMSKTSMQTEQVVFVGDSLIDAETALRGGVDFVAVLTGTTSADQFSSYSPKAVLDSVTEIEKYAELGASADAE
jgi:phosphoglycolate phosphatase